MNVLDLFSGCGGLSLGFKTAGFSIVAHIDNDEDAYDTAIANIRPDQDIDGCLDITSVDKTHPLLSALNNNVDVIIGGPPCQAYSTAGRGKLSSLVGNKNAHLADERGQLYKHYLRICEVLKPKAILIENVPAILNYGGDNIPEIICSDLSKKGYRCSYTMLNAASYGVPQYRERVFIMCISDEFNEQPMFPEPTHSVPHEEINGLTRMENIISDGALYAVLPPLCNNPSLPPPVTAGDAIEDLPFLTTLNGSHWNYRMDKPLSYRSGNSSKFISMMRNWPGFPASETVTGNKCRDTPRDFAIFSRMKGGDKYPEALAIAEILYNEVIGNFISGTGRRPNKREDQLIRKQTVPPYDPNKFQDKWRKLEMDRPAHTLVAHLSSDTYSHIHYDSKQARGISVREAARLQSFPDNFIFSGTLSKAYRQIGNAVPPLLAFHLAKSLKKYISS